MEITDSLLKRLETQGPQSLEALVAAFPEFSEDACRVEALRLLLRLDTRIRRLGDGRWALIPAAQTPDQRVADATRGYLAQLPGAGARLDAVVNFVYEQTGFRRDLVRSVVLKYFDHRGQLVFKPKEVQ